MSALSKAISQFENIEIVGFGLAGILTANALEKSKIPFTIYDDWNEGISTPIAPGIFNPLAGRKFLPPALVNQYCSVSSQTFGELEEQLGEKIWRSVPIQRFFFNDSQIKFFSKALGNQRCKPFIGKTYNPNERKTSVFDEKGSFDTVGSGWADLPLLYNRSRQKQLQQGNLIESAAPPEPPAKKTLRIYTEGWHAERNELWSMIPFNPSKGEILFVEFEDFIDRNYIYNKSCWLQPLPNSTLWRCGATYSWDQFDSSPSPEGTKVLEDRLKELTPIPFRIVDQVAGVRPIVQDYNPVVGFHPNHSNCFIINGLGSKGVVQAPYLIQEIFRAEGKIPAEMCVNRF